jgi:hypothetical protein
MAPKKATFNIPPTSRARTKRSDGHVDLSPLESRVETALFERHEGVLRLNYDIPLAVRMFYQTPGTRVIDDGDVTLFEREHGWTPATLPGDRPGLRPFSNGCS